MRPSPLRPLAIPELRALREGKSCQVDQAITGLDTLTPVRGVLRVRHHGTALEVTAEVDTILTLCCARCLQQFNQALHAEVVELIPFHGGSAGASADTVPGAVADAFSPEEDLEERLDPQGRFDGERWLFEQLSLRLPLVNRCGNDCPGPARWSSDPAGGDPRWAALQALCPPSPPTAPTAESPLPLSP